MCFCLPWIFVCVLVINVIYVLNVVDLLIYNCIYNERLLQVYRESFLPIMYYKINLWNSCLCSYAYTCICIDVPIRLCVYLYLCALVFMRIFVFVCTCVYTYICICVPLCLCVYLYLCALVFIRIFVFVCLCVYLY